MRGGDDWIRERLTRKGIERKNDQQCQCHHCNSVSVILNGHLSIKDTAKCNRQRCGFNLFSWYKKCTECCKNHNSSLPYVLKLSDFDPELY